MALLEGNLNGPTGSRARARAELAARTSPRRLLVDRAARWVVTGGGLAIIASILGILIFILAEVWPLTRPAQVAMGRSFDFDRPTSALLVDEYQTHVASVDPRGEIRVVRFDDGEIVAERSLLAELRATGPTATAETEEPSGGDTVHEPEIVALHVPPGAQAIVAATSDGRIVGQPLKWRVEFDAEQQRSVHAEFPPLVAVELDPEHRPLGSFAARLGDDDGVTAAAQLGDGTVAVLRRESSRNDFTGEVSTSEERLRFPAVPTLSTLLLDGERRNLYGGTANGQLYWWRLDAGDSVPPAVASAGSAAVSAMTFLIGDRSLVVGQRNGAISVWFPVRQDDESFALTRIRDFPQADGAITQIAPSRRNRTFLVEDEVGDMALYYSTSERTLWSGRSPVAGATAAVISPKSDGAFLASADELAFVEIENPHPEVSLRALFGKVWYEGYPEPDLIWQSTGGTDDFESKLSLTPIIFGTIKGTIYSLLIAIPLAILGAMFASQFLHPKLLALIKPTVEIMAALPSVVLGFLAGLWLAPILERIFPAVLLMFLLVPLFVWLSGVAWSRVPQRHRGRLPAGAEVFLYLGVAALGLSTALQLGPAFERLAFAGHFQGWLYESTGMRYDQRNAVVVGLAMGFAVIPIIFAIAEDAFSNVPRNLVAGSLALGANRWQTVTRVVLPTASPGIFSAVMIGFGRAIGETMIVLMATGNTPIMDWSPFNGFRTLSANIAVEIPEAPFGGTLYRTLFLAAFLLFVFTFVVNTVAELVRQRLRSKYSQL